MPFSPTNPPELVIFDNDGVLIDSEILAGEANAQALAAFGVKMDAAEATHCFIGLGPAGMTDSLLALGIDDVAAYEKTVGQAMGHKIKTELNAIDGAIDLIAALKAAGIPVCVCSNADEQWLVTTHQQVGLSSVLNPLHYFHRDLVAHETGVGHASIGSRHIRHRRRPCVGNRRYNRWTGRYQRRD